MSKKIHIPDDIIQFFKQIEGTPVQTSEVPSFVALTSEELREITRTSRKALGVTQSTIGDLAGITLSTVQKIERGDLKVNLQNFLKMMDVLGIEVCLKKK